MTQEVRYPEWFDQFEPTKYPFEDGCNLTTLQGKVLPDSIFLDARLNLVNAGPDVRLSEIVVESGRITLWLGDRFETRIASASIDPSSSARSFRFLDTDRRAVGVMLVGPGAVSLFRAWGLGSYEFPATAATLVASTYVTLPSSAVIGFRLDDGSTVGGNVVLMGGPGVVLEVDELELPTPCEGQIGTGLSSIRVNIVGDPLFKRRLCEPEELFASPNFIQQICFSVPGRTGDPNFPDKDPEIVCCGPGDFGDIKITAGQNDSDSSILRVRVSSEGIVLEAIGERI